LRKKGGRGGGGEGGKGRPVLRLVKGGKKFLQRGRGGEKRKTSNSPAWSTRVFFGKKGEGKKKKKKEGKKKKREKFGAA